MATQEQIEANRINAQKSTGPQTPAGKARAAQNATTHGLAGETVVMYGEDPAQFRAFHAGLTADVAPRGALEAMLVERIAAAAWRLRRATRIERGMMESALRPAGYGRPFLPSVPLPDDAEPAAEDERPAPRYFTLGRELAARLCADDACGRLARYEAHIERGLYRAMRELRLLRQQAARGQWSCAVGLGAGARDMPNKVEHGTPRADEPRADQAEDHAPAGGGAASGSSNGCHGPARRPRAVSPRRSHGSEDGTVAPGGDARDMPNKVEHGTRREEVKIRNEPNPPEGEGREGKLRNEPNRPARPRPPHAAPTTAAPAAAGAAGPTASGGS